MRKIENRKIEVPRMKKFITPLLFLILAEFLLAEDVLRPRGREIQNQENNIIENKELFSIGFELGLNYNIQSVDQSWNAELDQSIFRVGESMDGFSPFFGIFADYSIDDKMGVQGKLQYGSVYLDNSVNARADCIIYDQVTGLATDIILEDVETDYNYSFDQLNLEFYFRYNFTSNFFGMIGPIFLLPVSDESSELTQTIDDDSECYFLADPNDPFSEQRKSQTTSFEASDALTRVGLGIIVGYKYYFDDFWIAPNLQYQLVPTLHLEDVSFPDNTQINYRTNNGIFPAAATVTAENHVINHLRLSVQVGFDIIN